MKVIYAILTATGWIWLVVVMVYLWIRWRRDRIPATKAPPGFPVVIKSTEPEQDEGANVNERAKDHGQ